MNVKPPEMDPTLLGTLKPGESKEFTVALPMGYRFGDVAVVRIYWTCGDCKEKRVKKFKALVGLGSGKVTFGCDCRTPWGWFRRLFA